MKRRFLGINKVLKSHKYLYELTPFFLLLLVVSLIYSFLFKVYPLEVMVDAFRYNGYQMYIMKYSFIRYGQFALWDQFLSSGMSWISHPGGPLFFPVAWIIIFLISKFTLGSVIYFFLHLLTGAGAFYFLLRVLGMRKATCFFVSISYITTYYVFIFLISGWFEELFGLTLLPLSVGLLILALSKKNYWYAILGGIVMSMNFFGNTYYVFHYNTIVLIWVALVSGINKIFKKREGVKVNFRYFLPDILINVFFWVTFIGLSAVKLFPLLEFRSISSRNVLPLSAIETPDAVMTFSFFFDRVHNFLFSADSFAGILKTLFQLGNNIAIGLIFVCVFYAFYKKNRIYVLFAGLLLIGAWGSLANRLPFDLYAFFYYFLPGFNSNQFPYRFTIIINFAFFVCLALGFNLFMKSKKKLFVFLGYFLGAIFVLNGFLHASFSYKNNNTAKEFNIENELRKPLTFNIEKYNTNIPPKINGKINTNLLTVLIQIINKYKPEGRMHSTFVSTDNASTTDQLLLGEIPSVQNSYDSIVPTYQYGIIRKLDTSKDSFDTFTRQFKIYSVLNTRFHLQQKEYFEYYGCTKLNLLKQDRIKENEGNNASEKDVCGFLENRLTKVLEDNKGGIYYDSEVLSRATLVQKAILLINDNRFNDYSGFIAKRIMFHPDFDEKKISIFSDRTTYLDDYTLEELKKFSAVLIVDPKIRNNIYAEKLIQEYQKSGGSVVRLDSRYIPYENLHERSSSIWKEKSAWNYSEENRDKLAELFKALSKAEDNIGVIKIEKFTPEDLVFKVSTKNNNEVLQYSDSFFPGWKAEIDGRKTKVYMADGLVKGIIIKNKGRHNVRFYYDPDSFKKGAVITLTTILVLIVLLMRKWYINKKK